MRFHFSLQFINYGTFLNISKYNEVSLLINIDLILSLFLISVKYNEVS